ncbi:hypothetical protein DL93DRAFT_350491 [Clavulina sp. PMI_390]|nr:hypothetical protein DL93DRAFT_350491 [Clavulina sp. PMI_390]
MESLARYFSSHRPSLDALHLLIPNTNSLTPSQRVTTPTMSRPRVAYVVSETLAKASAALPSNRGRSPMVHALANALGFFKAETLPNLRAFKPSAATSSDLCLFHDSEYIGWCHRIAHTALGF